MNEINPNPNPNPNHEQLARLHLRCDRKLLRKVLNVFWPKRKRLLFYGHMMRMPDDVPVNAAMAEYNRPLKMDHGAPQVPWRKNK